jgi:type IV pilus assembly protein PilB
MSPYRTTKTEIGRLLLQKGLISSSQLQEALAIQRQKQQDKRLGQILVELGYLSKDDLYFVLAMQSGYPYIDIKRCVLEPEIVSLIPAIMIKKYQVFPIDKIQDVVTIAMVNPLDNMVIDQIQEIVKSNIKIFLTIPFDLNEMMTRYLGKNKPASNDTL